MVKNPSCICVSRRDPSARRAGRPMPRPGRVSDTRRAYARHSGECPLRHSGEPPFRHSGVRRNDEIDPAAQPSKAAPPVGLSPER